MIKITNTLNQLYIGELVNAQVYQNFATRFRELSLENFAKFFTDQSNEEAAHAIWFRDFMIDMGETPEVTNISNIEVATGQTVAFLAQRYFELEEETTEYINQAYLEAEMSQDVLSKIFLHKLINEQIEEIGKAMDFRDKVLALSNQAPASYVLFDQELEV